MLLYLTQAQLFVSCAPLGHNPWALHYPQTSAPPCCPDRHRTQSERKWGGENTPRGRPGCDSEASLRSPFAHTYQGAVLAWAPRCPSLGLRPSFNLRVTRRDAVHMCLEARCTRSLALLLLLSADSLLTVGWSDLGTPAAGIWSRLNLRGATFIENRVTVKR